MTSGNPLRSAAVAALVVLFVTGCGSTSVRSPADGPRTSPTPEPTDAGPTDNGPAENRAWPVETRSRADVDGDGQVERLRLRAPDLPGPRFPVQLVVERADGSRSVTGLVRQPLPGLYRSDDVDGRPGEEVLLMAEGNARAVTPLTWRDGRQVPMRTPPGFPLTDDYVHGHRSDWWVEDGHLVSTRSVRPFEFDWDTVEVPASYAVHAWRWTADGLDLQPRRRGLFCVRHDEPQRLLPLSGGAC
ncbi:hypothetical protein GCM10009844_10360 [Nocardioides koreensis]|uniref:Lipoprotein n=1 Tax=Nocardioides koreensis TaxID=433651 RepID=A0ABN2ZDL0_9ACTN